MTFQEVGEKTVETEVDMAEQVEKVEEVEEEEEVEGDKSER